MKCPPLPTMATLPSRDVQIVLSRHIIVMKVLIRMATLIAIVNSGGNCVDGTDHHFYTISQALRDSQQLTSKNVNQHILGWKFILGENC